MSYQVYIFFVRRYVDISMWVKICALKPRKCLPLAFVPTFSGFFIILSDVCGSVKALKFVLRHGGKIQPGLQEVGSCGTGWQQASGCSHWMHWSTVGRLLDFRCWTDRRGPEMIWVYLSNFPSYKWINPTKIPFITGVITHLRAVGWTILLCS